MNIFLAGWARMGRPTDQAEHSTPANLSANKIQNSHFTSEMLPPALSFAASQAGSQQRHSCLCLIIGS